ncbi:MAG: TRAP transporter substrate-binding protein [Burkholderiales bacterium]
MKLRLAALSILGLGVCAAGPAAAQNVTLRFSQWVPAAHFTMSQGFHKYFEDVARVTEGRVKIEPTAQALGAPPRHMQLAVDGISDVSWGVHGYTPGTYPLAEIVELPFITKNAEVNSSAYWRVYKAMFEKTGMHPAGVHTLTLHVHPAGHVYNNKRAIRTVDDFKGLKLRTINNSTTDSFKALGAIPLPLPATQMRDALSKGIADGTGFTDEGIFNFRVEEFVKHATHIPGGLYNTSFFMVMNKAKWDAISKKDQDAIMAISGEVLARRIGKLWDAEENISGDKLKARGVEYLTADAAMLGKMREIFAGQEKKWLEDAKAKGVDGAAALRMFRDELAK